MSSELNLVTQLAIILISAGICTVIFKALKQPLILGYIVAGFIVGPHLGLFPQFDAESVHEWSELGIIFLLFGLGLEFSFKKLLSVGSAAIIAAGTICLGMFVVGSITGTALGWTKMESIFLGGMLSMSSTTIIIKAYDDLGIKQKPYATLVFGLLVVEDLLAVLMMVLFSTLAVSNKFSGMDMVLSLCKLTAFLIICFVVGIYLIPSILKKTKSYLSDEILLLISVGMCFTMVILANKAGFSSALGAFLIGSILSSTIEGEAIENITTNIKNLFGAIFFVSVGMMVDPLVIARHWPVILAITLVAMTGILIFSTGGVLLAGKDLDTAIHVGFSLPQLGEFSFIIAGLGTSLGAISDFIYPVIISVSVITTFTTPYMIKAADPVSAWAHRKLPANLLAIVSRDKSIKSSTSAEQLAWKEFIRKYIIRVGLYSILSVVILLGIKAYLPGLTEKMCPHIGQSGRNFLDVCISLAILFPFLYGMAVNGKDLRTIARNLIAINPKAKFPVRASIFFRISLAVTFAIAAIMLFENLSAWLIILIYLLLISAFVFARNITARFTGFEDRFINNLNAKDNLTRQMAPVTSMVQKKFAGYDITSEISIVSSDFTYAGETLREMPFRHTSGVNIVKIKRGSQSILIPSGGEKIFPGDKLVAVGTREQLDAFKKEMKDNSPATTDQYEDFNVEAIQLTSDSQLTGVMLKDTSMRAMNCMVISVIRDGEIHTNPSKDFTFKENDIVWLAGLQSSIDWYKVPRSPVI